MRFSEIPGNQEIKQKLIGTVLDQRVSHAQLFFGPNESEKLALAIALAQFINCTNKQGLPSEAGLPGLELHATPDSCGSCPSCVKYQKLAHPDLHFIYPVSTTKKVTKKPQSRHFIEDWRTFLLENQYNCDLQGWYEQIGIENKQGIINADDCNDIITTLGYKSYESEYKVMVIWMVERLFYSAAPKILKILEEPPEKTLFLLIAEEPDQIIKTILSRTLMVRIPSSPSTPLAMEEDSVNFVTFRQWMRLCFSAKIPDLIRFVVEISKIGREKQKSFLHYALKTIGACATLNYLGSLHESAEAEEMKFITGFAPFITTANLGPFNTLLNEAIYHIERNAYPGTLFLDLSIKVVKLLKPDSLPSLKS